MRKLLPLIIVILLVTLAASCINENPLKPIQRIARSSDLGDKENAAELYKTSIDTLVDAYAEYASLNKAIGERLMFNKEFKPAIKHLELAKEIENEDSTLYFWLGVCYVNLYKIENSPAHLIQAEENYKIAYTITPTHSDLLYSYAHLLVFATKQYNKAEELLRDYVKQTEDPQGWFLLGRTYYLQGNLSQAYDTYNEIYRFEAKLTSQEKDALEEHIYIIRSELEKGLTN